MKIVVIGGTGLIGAKLVKVLQDNGHDVLAASRSTGVDATTGKGLKAALQGADVIVDVANSPSFDEETATAFFENSTRHLIEAEKAAGIKHHVLLSVVGTDRLSENGYFKAKNLQEKLIAASTLPYTIVQSTQFFEFLDSIVQSATEKGAVHLPDVSFQPIAADDVVKILAEIALEAPHNATIEITGPKRSSFPTYIQNYLNLKESEIKAVADEKAGYFGMEVKEETLVPSGKAHLGTISLEKWFEGH